MFIVLRGEKAVDMCFDPFFALQGERGDLVLPQERELVENDRGKRAVPVQHDHDQAVGSLGGRGTRVVVPLEGNFVVRGNGVRHVIDILPSADPDLQAGEVGNFPFGGEHVEILFHEEGVAVCFQAMSFAFPHLFEQGFFKLLVETQGHGQVDPVLLLFGRVCVVIFQRVGADAILIAIPVKNSVTDSASQAS